MKLNINPRFERLLPPLTEEEDAELRRSLEQDGQQEPIDVAKIEGVPDTIVDGHNRYRHLRELKREPTIRVRTFASIEAAEEWIIRKQLARRNVDPRTRKELIGRLYNAAKVTHGGARISSTQNEYLKKTSGNPEQNEDAGKKTAEVIAEDFSVSRATVQRSGKYVDALDKLPDNLANALRKRPNVATEKAVIKLASLPETKHHEFARDLRTGATSNLDEWLGLRRKPATEKPAAKESTASEADSPSEEVSASVVLDDLDRDVPKRLLKPHQDGQILAEFARAVSKAKSYAKNLLDGDDPIDGAAFLDVKQVVRDLDTIRRDITQSIYYTECPRCKGKTKADCSRCGGNGWIPRRDKGVLSDEERAWLEAK